MDDHGKVVGNARKCRIHGEHGQLYPCPEYDKQTLNEIAISDEKYKANLRSKSWCEKQIKTGSVDAYGIAIFRGMAGVDDWTE